MSEYDTYVTYRNATDQIRERVQSTERARMAGPRRSSRTPGRRALARRLHSIADLLEG